jgi:2-polyprenyl-6-methoxyphenol hydroxylase-like FAD-dependent oxidoreductase
MERHKSNPDVLIVGAGPTGLILAHELLRRGIACRMVERRTKPSGSTRAFTLHARTMEMFDHMGIAPHIDRLREVCPGNLFHFQGLETADASDVCLDFRRLSSTVYNYYGKVNQNDLDQVLRETLASRYSFFPEYGVEYVGSEQVPNGVVTHLRHLAGGCSERCETEWVVGADGSGSSVREALGLAFQQNSGNSMTMSMVDVTLDGFNGDRAWVNYFVAERGFMLVTGLPGRKFRLYLAGALEKFMDEGTPQEAFQRALDHFSTGATIRAMDWSSKWTIRKIVCESYFRDRIVLCGDATHVHSPAGGQGMNACMQDAFNLGWKLALIVKGNAAPDVLGTYPAERRPIAEQVTAGADRMHQILFNAAIPIAERYALTQDPAWHDDTVARISGLSHNYRATCSNDDHVGSDSPIQTGDRAPDCLLSDEAPCKRLYDVFRHTGFTVLFVGQDARAIPTVRTAIDKLVNEFGRAVKCVVVRSAPDPQFNYDETAIDSLGRIEASYHVSDGGEVLIIRPDLYFGFRGRLRDMAAAEALLQRWMNSMPGCAAGSWSVLQSHGRQNVAKA